MAYLTAWRVEQRGLAWLNRLAALIFVSATSVLAQPPSIDQESIVNEASRIAPSLPGGALAPNTRIVIKGFRFGPSPRVHLASADQMAEVRILSAAPRELLALLPSTIPEGPAELTVSNADGPSRPFPIRIAKGSPGLYTQNGGGWGPAKILASHGNRVTILATGAGGQAPGLKVFVGGKRARFVSLQSDEHEPGVEKLEFEIPSDAPSGCQVPVLARLSDGLVSNTATITNGHCDPNQQDPFAGEPASQTSALVLLARLHVQSGSSVADLTQDYGAGIFAPAETVEKVLGPYRLMPPEGTCSTYTGLYSGDIASTLLPPLSSPFRQEGLEAGPELLVNGPNGTRVVQRHKRPGVYGRIIGYQRFLTATSRPPFLSPGSYSVSWRGGEEVPGFTIHLSVPSPFSWTNATKISFINRNKNLSVKWRPGSRSQRMAIVAVNVDPSTTAMATCFCLASKSAASFSVPAMMLANLPKTPEHNRPAIPISLLALVPLDELQRFHAPGLDLRALVTIAQARSVIYR